MRDVVIEMCVHVVLRLASSVRGQSVCVRAHAQTASWALSSVWESVRVRVYLAVRA